MGSEHYVGREAAVEKLQRVLQGHLHIGDRKLVVQSIEGPGGIGKTALFDYAAGKVDLAPRKFLTLRISGNDESAKSTSRSIRHMIDSGLVAGPTKNAAREHFPHFSEVEAAYDQIRREAVAEIATDDSGVSADVLLGLLDMAVAVGKPLNDLFPATATFLNIGALEKKVAGNRDAITRLIHSSATLAKEASGWLGKLGFGGASDLRNAIRENALLPISEALMKDLTTMLSGYPPKDLLKPRREKSDATDRLLLIVDDYETTQSVLGDLLVNSLLPALQRASFESTVVILGRDQLQATHVSWAQHLEPSLTGALRLDPLSRQEMNDLLALRSVSSAKEQARAWTDTEGYPFNVLLWLEEVEEGGRTALMLKRFHDRTTRWMTDEEKRWLNHTLFLSNVDKRTLGLALGNEVEAARANAWFQKEASVRDPRAASFKVREYLRSRLADYLQLSDPDLYEELRHASSDQAVAA